MTLEELYNLLFGSYNPIQKGLVILALIAFIVLFMKNPVKRHRTLLRPLQTFSF